MGENIDALSYTLGLSPYQRSVISLNHDKYNLSRLVMRGRVLYAPRSSCGIWRRIVNMLRGAPADLIGENKTFLFARRGIKFFENGYHCLGSQYWSADGRPMTRDAFCRATRRTH